MKKLVSSFIIIIGGLIIISSPIKAQDVVKAEKKIRVKIVNNEDGKRVVTDTIIVGKSEEDIIGDKSKQKNKLIVITSDDDLNDENSQEVDDNIIIYDDGSTYDIIKKPKGLKKTFQIQSEFSNKVSDIELRDAGIKNKPDRLNVTNIEIDIDGGIVNIEYTLQKEKTSKVIVYNVYGDKVFKGKPEVIDGNCKIKIDLSSKQHGTYYLQLVSGNSSLTQKLKI